MLELQNIEDVGSSCPHMDVLGSDEMECKICYAAYNLESCRPKVLECCHRLCSNCLIRILDLGESPPNALVCPFCRYVTRLLGDAVRNLPDDCNLVAKLDLQSRNQRNLLIHQDSTTELLLSPRCLNSLMGANLSGMSYTSSTLPYSTMRSSPNFVVITLRESPPASTPTRDLCVSPCRLNQDSSSLDSLASISQRLTMWNCTALLCKTLAQVLVWVLGLLYFSSLPMGIYLLIMQRTTVGVLLVSLVPASLVMILVYGFCQCICYELWHCWPP
ncbi:E3 ubiquitin-protein ligase RNF182 [Girardinichthys multiradiatus]|uniref:E3 ubiquitin-protein ligase RNF182 n=1 Tax=Girardinichthys multiradiatus TaxID=208333 RepID=UPI001FAC90DC|nr:E3 ubiquitin-protein ligase RNF182 [Girardinichthys multiradiatus]